MAAAAEMVGKSEILRRFSHFRVEQQLDGGEAPVALNHHEAFVFLLDEERLMLEVPTRADRHGQFVHGHLLPEDLEQLLLGRLLAKGILGQAGIVGVEKELPNLHPFVGLAVCCLFGKLRFCHRSTRPIRLDPYSGEDVVSAYNLRWAKQEP